MTDPSDGSPDHIDHLYHSDGPGCDHTKAFYRIQIQNTINQGQQVDAETQTTTGVATKDTTEGSVTGEAGLSGPVPKFAVKGGGKKKATTEFTGSESDVNRRSASVTQGVSIEYEVINPNDNEVDIANPNIISGCRTTVDENNGDVRCGNHIQTVMSNHVSNIIGDSKDTREEVSEIANEDSLSELETPKSQETSTFGRYTSRIRDGFENAVGTVRNGLTTTVEKARDRFADDDATLSVSPDDGTELGVTHRDDGTSVTLADGSTGTVGTTVAVGAGGEFQPSYNDDGSFTVDIAEETDATIQVSPGDDDADWSVTDDGVEMGLADGGVTVDQGGDDLQMETDEDGRITLTMGDGHTPERSNTTDDGNNTKTNDGTAEATNKSTTTAAEPAQSTSKGTPSHANGADGTDSSQTQNSDTTPFLGYDEGREQARHRNGHDSTGTTNSEEASNDADNDEEKDPGGTSL